MIRKITHIIFAILLLVTSAGFTLSKHYCHNQLREVVIDKEAESCCGMEEGCCKTETVLIQLNDEAVANAAVSVPANLITSIQPMAVIHLLTILVAKPVDEVFREYISPPPRKIQTVLSSIQSYLL